MAVMRFIYISQNNLEKLNHIYKKLRENKIRIIKRSTRQKNNTTHCFLLPTEIQLELPELAVDLLSSGFEFEMIT